MVNNMKACEQLANRPNIYGEYACKHWQQLPDTLILGNDHITPELAGALITFALIINVLAMGIRGMRQSF